MDKWTELRTASYVAKLGTVSAAAQALNVHRATINRHIDTLEGALGGPVFLRHARGYTLTELGQDALRVAQKTEDLITDLAGRARGSEANIAGEVRLTILAPFADLVMQPIISFRDKNPHARIKIDVSEDLAKLEYAEAHIAIRAGTKPDHPDYVVQPLGSVMFGLYAHRSYAERYGLPDNENDLSTHRFVVPSLNSSRVPFAEWMATNLDQQQVALECTNALVNKQAIQAGIGLGFLAQYNVARDDAYHCVVPPKKAWSVRLWLVTHVDLHRTQKVQALLEVLKDNISHRLSAQGDDVTP